MGLISFTYEIEGEELEETKSLPELTSCELMCSGGESQVKGTSRDLHPVGLRDNTEEIHKFTWPSGDSNRIYVALKSKELDLVFTPGRIKW